MKRRQVMPKLKIYTEIPEEHDNFGGVSLAAILYPIYKEVTPSLFGIRDSFAMRMAGLYEKNPSLFEASSLEDCDLVILPYDWQHIRGSSWQPQINWNPLNKSKKSAVAELAYKANKDLYQKAQKANKKSVIFFNGPRASEALPFKDAVVFRNSLYQKRRRPNDFVKPAFSEDIVNAHLDGEIKVRKKQADPVVGFCGLAKTMSAKNYPKLLAYYTYNLINLGYPDVSPYSGEALRINAMEKLDNQPGIKTNYIVRKDSIFLGNQNASRAKYRQEYIDNLVSSDYVICCRGSANTSYRLYETLCVGRIPIFINTDCGLPYDFIVDWKKYFVWVEEEELDRLPEKVLEFHNRLSDAEFVELQKELRQLWLKWLSPEGFFSNFFRHF